MKRQFQESRNRGFKESRDTRIPESWSPRVLFLCRLSLALCCLPLALHAQPPDRIVTDYYQAQPNATGGLDFYGLDGEQIITGMCVFRASYFFGGAYRTIVGNVATFPEVRESNDTTQVSALENLGVVRVACCYTLVRHSPFVECRVVLNYQQDIDSVFYETVETGLSADSAWVVTRDRREIPASSSATYVTDKWTTRAAQFGFGPDWVTFPGEDNMLALRLSRPQGHWLLTYDLDRDFDHPFFRNYNSFPGYVTYDTLANTPRRPETDSFFFRLAVGAQVPILKKECQPSGCQAALVMTEHADCEGPLTSLAIAFGSSAADTPLPGRGVLGNGLTWTKSVFRWHTFGGGGFVNQGYYGLDRPDFKAVVDTLYRRGVEIALHTPSAMADTVNRVAATLRDMSNWYRTRTWIDHGMPYNPEAISRFGTEPESTEWYSLDSLRDNGIDYVWQSIDMSGLGVWDNSLFVPGQTDFYPPILYTQPRLNNFGQSRPMYLWPAWVINDNSQRDMQLSPDGITHLIRQRGIEILHLYFADQDTTVHRYQPSQAEWLIPHWNFPNISWESDPWIDGYFQFIANCKQQGLLWVPTLSQLADYMLLMDSVAVRAQTDRQFAVTNTAARPIPGFTLSVRAEGISQIALNGQPVTNRRNVDNDILFWFDLPPDTTLILTLTTDDYADSDQTLAPSQNPHLEYHAGVYHRVFVDRQAVWYQQSQDSGSNWSPAETVGIGQCPSLVLSDRGIPVVCFDSAGLVQARRRSTPDARPLTPATWSVIPLAFDTTDWESAVCGGLAASRLNDSLGSLYYLAYTARRRTSPQLTAHRLPPLAVSREPLAVSPPSIRLAVFDTTGLLLDTMVCEAVAGNADTLPSIAVTPADILHIAWQHERSSGNEILYRTTQTITPAQVRHGQPLVFSPVAQLTQFGTLCPPGANPVVCAFGDSVTCVWQGPNQLNQPVEEVWTRSRWLYDSYDHWSPALDLSQTPGQRSLNPVISNRVCLWQEEVSPGNTDIVGIAPDGRFILSSTPTQSVYPHLNVRLSPYAPGLSPSASLGALWAGFDSTWHSWQLLFQDTDIALTQPISYYQVACGESVPSPYCRHRDSILLVDGHRIDTGSESLAYALPWLDPARNYQLLCRFYPPASDTLYQDLFINDSLFASFAIPPSRTETLLLAVPPNFYAGTGSINVKLTSEAARPATSHQPPASAPVVLEGITVFENQESTHAQGTKGGTQGSSTPGPRPPTPALWVSGPNPSTGAVTISYQLSRPDFVKLSLYDIAGRQVQKLAGGYRLAGNYSVRVSGFGFRGSRPGGGVYICRLETGSGVVSRKLILISR